MFHKPGPSAAGTDLMERLMHQSSPAIFVGDAPALDFLNSIATPVDIAVDWIADGAGLLNWLEQAQLVPAEVLKDMRRQAPPGELDAVADQARKLREWFRAFVQKHKGRPLVSKSLEELAPLNRLLDRDEIFAQIMATARKRALAPGAASPAALARTRSAFASDRRSAGTVRLC